MPYLLFLVLFVGFMAEVNAKPAETTEKQYYKQRIIEVLQNKDFGYEEKKTAWRLKEQYQMWNKVNDASLDYDQFAFLAIGFSTILQFIFWFCVCVAYYFFFVIVIVMQR